MSHLILLDLNPDHKYYYGEMVRMAVTSGCISLREARCFVALGDINVRYDFPSLWIIPEGDIVKEFTGLSNIASCNFIPARIGRHSAQGAAICWVMPGVEVSNKVEFTVVKRKIIVVPTLSNIFLSFNHVNEVIPIDGKVILTPTISGYLSPQQPSVGDLEIVVYVTVNGTPLAPLTTRTLADGSFNIPYTPTVEGTHEVRILCNEGDYTDSDSRTFTGIVSKKSAGIVAESLLLGKLKPVFEKTYKAGEEISIAGRLVYGKYSISNLTDIIRGIPQATIRLKANDVDVGTFKTDDLGNFVINRTGQQMASLLGIDLSRIFENKTVTFKAYFDGDLEYTPCDADTRVWLLGRYVSMIVKVSEAQKLLKRLKFGEEIKISGAVLKMSLGSDGDVVNLKIADDTGKVILTQDVKTGTGGVFSSSFKVDGAPVGKDGTYTITATYVDPDTGMVFKADDTVELEKWYTNITMTELLIQKILKRFYLGVPAPIEGSVDYTEKGGGPSGVPVTLYVISELEDQGRLIDLIKKLALKGIDITSADKQEIRDILAQLAGRVSTGVSDSTLAGMFSIMYTPDKIGTVQMVVAASEDLTRYGCFQFFSIEVVKTPAQISLVASERNVKLTTNTLLSGKLSLFEHEEIGIQDQLDIYADELKDMGGTKKLIPNIKNNPDGTYSIVWSPTACGFFVLMARHDESKTVSGCTSVSTSVAVYTMDGSGKWIDPFDGSSFDTEAELIDHINKHHADHDKAVGDACPDWRPYHFGSVVGYMWCRVKEFLGLNK